MVAEESPGAIDNAGSVAVALEVALECGEQNRRDVPVGFTDGEELGLHGARYLAKSLPPDEKPEFVVALEFRQGQLTAMGVGERWGLWPALAEPVEWWMCLTPTELCSLFPSRERSDHKPFVDAGALGMLLLGRGASGVYWPYHMAKTIFSGRSQRARGRCGRGDADAPIGLPSGDDPAIVSP